MTPSPHDETAPTDFIREKIDADLAAGGLLGLLIQEPVGEVVLGLLDVAALGGFLVDGARDRALENVFLLLGKVVEDFGGEVEILGDDFLGSVLRSIMSVTSEVISNVREERGLTQPVGKNKG